MAPRKKKVDYVDKDSSSKSVEKKNYEHYVKASPTLDNFEEVYKLEHHLIKSYDELMDFYKNKFKPDSFFAWDTETTSLNAEQGAKTGDLVEGRIVGYSFTQDGHNGYYVPLCHPDIAIGYKGLKVLYAMVKRSKLNLLYNARFDMRFLEFMTPEKYNYTPEPDEKIYNFDLSDVKYFDVQCAVWLSDTNVPMPSLKKSEKHFLGWNPPTFADTTGGEANFGYLPASQGYRYACIEENTLIKTTNGDKKIKDITVNDTVYSSSGPNKVLAVYNNGIKHAIKCTYKNDYTLVCTPDHKIAVNTVLGPRLVQAKDLDAHTTLYTGGVNFNNLSDLDQECNTLSFNVSALQNIDFMYWLLGFTMADGSLVNNRLAYKVQKRDEHILYDIKSYVKSQSKISEILSKSPSSDSVNTAVNLYICNKVCCNFMREHGMTENKSTRKSYNVSDDVFPSFLRGVYDGDGSSNGNNICFIGYPEFIEKLQSDIYRLYGLTSSLHKNKLDDKVIVMTFTKYASLQLMNIMYGNATIFIKRKMEKALRKHKLFYVSKYNNYKKRANYTEIAREPVGVEEFQKLDHICKAFNISSSALSRVVSGKWNQYKGLTVTTNIGKLYKIAPNSMNIEDIGDRQVFDLQIENDPSFITSNGFIVHNCIDALGTYHLFFKTETYYAESGAAGKLDNESLYPIMRLENTPIYIDHEYLKAMRVDILKHLSELKQWLYTNAGTEYNINSNRELVGVFQQLGIDTGKRTSTGLMETNIKAIENYLVSHNDNEYLKKLIEYKKLVKFDNSYLEKLLEISAPDEMEKHPIRFNYFTCRVPTGRLASGTDGKNRFFSPVNFQSIPKPHSHNYHVHKATEEQIANGEDLCGWIFDDNPENSLGLTEGQDPHLNVRKAFTPAPDDEDSVIVSVDMKAEELRLVANVYNEPTWIHAFNTNQDVHKACYSDDTEFLTKDGWKTYDKIKEDTLIAQYDNGSISYVNAGPVYYGDTGELYRFKTKYNDLLVTSNHRMLYRTSYKGKEKIKPAENLNYGQFRNAAICDCNDLASDFIFEDCYGDGFNSNKKYADGFSLKPDTLIKFLGFYLGDGHAGVHKNRYRINLIQSCCEAKKETLQWVRDLNKEMGDFFKEHLHQAGKLTEHSVVKNAGASYYTFERSHKTFCKWIIDNCIKDGIKRIPEFVFNLSLRQRKLFIDAFFKADGTKDKRIGRKGFTLYIYNKELLDDFQRLCIMSNYSTYIDYKHKQTSGIYRMSVHPNVWHNFNQANISKEVYNGKTVCFSVPSGVLIVRRNGKVSICGNTAIKIFGEENYCKEARKKAKAASFGILYGSSAYGFHNQFPDMSLEECEDFISTFKATLPSIEKGQKDAVRYAKKNGYVKTYFGRPRRVKYYLNSSDYKQRSFGERTVKNTSVQGAAGDCLKLMLIRLWKDLFLPYKDKGVRFLGTIHDEINYIVPKSLLNEVAPIIMRCQRIALPDWPVVLEPDLSIGTSFGSLIPFDIVYNEDGTAKEFVPQMEPLSDTPHVDESIKDFVPEVEDDYNYLQ